MKIRKQQSQVSVSFNYNNILVIIRIPLLSETEYYHNRSLSKRSVYDQCLRQCYSICGPRLRTEVSLLDCVLTPEMLVLYHTFLAIREYGTEFILTLSLTNING